jgi:lipoprotein-anchoring transpeptidase ErfK/SrfK
MMAALCMHGAATVAAAQSGIRPDTGSWTVDTERSDAPNFILTPTNVRIHVSVAERRLWVIAGDDTLRTASVAVASGREFSYAGQRWRFATPRGRLTVQGKRTDPLWLPPDWHYAEVAKSHGLKLKRLTPAGVLLEDGSRLAIRDSVVGVVPASDSTAFLPLPVGEHIVFDSTLFIPPTSTINRHLRGELGPYSLDLGNGYMLHGTWDQSSIGSDGTHGCIRLADEDITWLYTYVPVGVTVVVR